MLDLGSTSMSLALAPAGVEEFPSGQKGGKGGGGRGELSTAGVSLILLMAYS
jgi:hypothetical protein